MRPWFSATWRAGAAAHTSAAASRQPAAGRQGAGGEPGREAGERHGQQEQPDNGSVGVSAAEQAQQPEDIAERIAVAGKPGPQPNPPGRGLVPDILQAGGDRQEAHRRPGRRRWKSPARPANEAAQAIITAARAPLPTQPRSLMERAAKSSVESPLGCSARESPLFAAAWVSSAPRASISERRWLHTSRRCSLESVDHGPPDPARACGAPPRPENCARTAEGRDRRQELGEPMPRVLDGDAEDQLEDAAQDCRHSMHGNQPQRCVLEPQVDLCPPRRRGIAQGMGPVGHVEHFGAGDHHHAVARQGGCASRSRRRRRFREGRDQTP